jgi:gas vesicle protein
MRIRHRSTVRSFFLGTVVGSGLAIVFAPAPGREMRSAIRRQFEHTTSAAPQLGERIGHEGREALDSAGCALQRIARR